VTDVWLHGDANGSALAAITPTTAVVTASASTTLHLSDLLSAPATELLPGHAADTHLGSAATTHTATQLHGLTPNTLDDELNNRANPLI
jgi:hypothetical protein